MKMVAVLFKYDSNEGYKHNTYGCLTFALYYLAVKKTYYEKVANSL